MAAVLSHPFRLTPTGVAATVLDGSSVANGEAIAVLALTRRGERTLVPTFGVTDPAFDDLDPAELNAGLTTFGPEGVTVTDVTTDYPSDTTAAIVIEFED